MRKMISLGLEVLNIKGYTPYNFKGLQMFEFVVVMTLVNILDEPSVEYVGNFNSCEIGEKYVKRHFPDATTIRCLHEDNIILPKNFKKRIIDVI